MELEMKTLTRMTLSLAMASLLSLAAAGCERNSSPAETNAAVAKAQASGEKDVAEARHDAINSTMDAQKDANKANEQLAHESAQANRDVALAEADAAYKVAIEKCQSLTGDERIACTKQADANLAAQKADAKSTERAADPKP
jgi:flagellar hook-basal body complex protein FliE